MNDVARIRQWWRTFPYAGPLRVLFFTVIVALVWLYPKKGVQDGILIAAFLYALPNLRRGWPAWRNAAGIAFLGLFVCSLLTLPLSTHAELSARDAVKVLDLFLVAFAMPSLFNTRKKLESALLYSASAVTILLSSHLVRMAIDLKGRLLQDAHCYEPFMMVHCNVESMVAGAAFLVFCFFTVKWRKQPKLLMLSALGAAANLIYLFVLASRGPQIAMAGAVSLSGFMFLRKWKYRVVWLGLLVAASVVVLAKPEWINPRFKDKLTMRGLAGRNVVWEHTWKLAKERPLLGHGYGVRTFMDVYHNSNPPESPYYFWHPHQYWLYILFAQGIVGVLLHAVAWGLLLLRLLRHILVRMRTFDQKLLPATVFLMITFISIYSLADWPSMQIHMMLIWLVPIALAVTRSDPPVVLAEGVTTATMRPPVQ
jgi:O-antigen ligase